MVVFENDVYEIYSNEIYHKVEKNHGFDTYCKEDLPGSLLVFEIKITKDKFHCISYCPLMLFGFIGYKISFKKKASWITRYRENGFKYYQELKNYIKNK